MKITEIRYQRVKNLGNYETERVEMVAVVNEGEHPKEVFIELREQVENYLELDDTDDSNSGY